MRRCIGRVQGRGVRHDIALTTFFLFAEAWLAHYKNAKTESTASEAQCEKMLQKIRKVCESLDTVIGGFVVRDLAILLGKWMKRGSNWVGD